MQHSDWLKMTGPVILSHYDTNQRVGGNQIYKHGFGNSKCRICAKAFRKLSIESNDVVHLKDEQEKTVDCLLDGRDVLAVMPTGFGIIFQLQ